MRSGWTDKEAAGVIGVAERKVSQALMPAYRKVARLWRVDSARTIRDILATIEDLEPMTDAELDMLQRMATGRLDRAELHPRSRR